VVSAGVTLASSTQNGTFIDCLGYTACMVLFNATTGAGTTANFTIDESPDGTTGIVAVAGATLAAPIIAAQTNAVYVGDINLKKRQRYLRADIVGTGTAGTATVTFLLFNASDMAVVQVNPVAFAV
jgi:hypothetical protein